MPTNQILPFATGGTPNVTDPATYAGASWRTDGFLSGLAPSKQVNTPLRQAAFVAAMVAQYISDTLGADVLDNGNLAALEAQFIAALNKQLTLGFTPVQQGGGPNQGANKVNIGWDTAAAGVRISIDGVNQGIYLPQSYIDTRDQSVLAAAGAAANAADAIVLASAKTYANGSYDTANKVFPGGYIIKNGTSVTNGGIQDFIAFPTAFPTNCLAVVACENNAQPSWGHNSSPTIYGVTAAQAGGFYISCEVFTGGGFVPGPGQGFQLYCGGDTNNGKMVCD